jgi:hypothetical protein
MPQIDATLVVLVISGHILQADLIVQAVTRTPDRGNHVVAWPEEGDVGADGFDPSESFVTDHEEVVPGWRLTVFRGVDLAIGPVDAHAEHAHQDAASVRHVRQ